VENSKIVHFETMVEFTQRHFGISVSHAEDVLEDIRGLPLETGGLIVVTREADLGHKPHTTYEMERVAINAFLDSIGVDGCSVDSHDYW